MEAGEREGERRHAGLVVIDVDGVIYRDVFLKKIVQSKGLMSFIRIISLGIDYYFNRIPIADFLEVGYRLAESFDVEKAREIAGEIRRATNIKRTVRILHENDCFVSLISVGVPDMILGSLEREIGADHSCGITIETRDGKFDSGTVRVTPKVETVERLLGDLHLTWNEVVAVGDDPHNIDLFKKSRLAIGFNPTRSVREHSDVVIEGNDLSEILPYIIPEENLPRRLRKERYFWKRELFRKGVHLLGCAFPFLARAHLLFTVSLLAAVMALYFLSELFRSRGVPYPALSHITRMARRHSEKGGIIVGPLLLGAGILLTVLFFDFPVYLPAVLIVSISDVVSALVGIKYGRTRLFNFRNRTLEGSLAFFCSSLGILLLTCPLRVAVPAAFIASILELVPMYNLDNLLIPLGTALFLHVMRGM